MDVMPGMSSTRKRNPMVSETRAHPGDPGASVEGSGQIDPPGQAIATAGFGRAVSIRVGRFPITSQPRAGALRTRGISPASSIRDCGFCSMGAEEPAVTTAGPDGSFTRLRPRKADPLSKSSISWSASYTTYNARYVVAPPHRRIRGQGPMGSVVNPDVSDRSSIPCTVTASGRAREPNVMGSDARACPQPFPDSVQPASSEAVGSSLADSRIADTGSPALGGPQGCAVTGPTGKGDGLRPAGDEGICSAGQGQQGRGGAGGASALSSLSPPGTGQAFLSPPLPERQCLSSFPQAAPNKSQVEVRDPRPAVGSTKRGDSGGAAGPAGGTGPEPPAGVQINGKLHGIPNSAVSAGEPGAVAPTRWSADTLDPLHLLRDVTVPARTGGRRGRHDLRYGLDDIALSLPSYAGLVAADAAGLPKRLAHSDPSHLAANGLRSFARARFAPAAVCTLHPALLREWLKPEEWQYVSTVTDVSLFRKRVLKVCDSGEVASRQATVRDVHLSRCHRDDLMAKGYLKRIRKAAFRCSIFAVWKADGALRLIWNGIPFNSLCNDPPDMHILPYPGMLAALLEPTVRNYVCYDFRTWFVQISVVAEVAQYFACRFPNGEIYVVCGVPMGWSWACAIAQALTQAFARAVIAEMGVSHNQVTLAFCIDNTIWAIRDSKVTTLAIMTAVTRVAARFGIQLKESATDLGQEVDWLPFTLNAQSHTASFKLAYRERLSALSDGAVRQKDHPAELIDVWRALGLLLFSAYAARIPLSDPAVKKLILWMGSHTPAQADSTAWQQEVIFPWWEEAATLARQLRSVTITAPPMSTGVARAWFVSDSATGSTTSLGHDVYILFLPFLTRVVVCVQTGSIAASELNTHINATRAALLVLQVSESRTDRGDIIVGFGDNVVALAAQRRGFALWADDALARRVTDLKSALEDAGMILEAPWVEGGDTGACLADVWTRGGDVGSWDFGPCTTHSFGPGRLCQCTIAALRTIAPSPELWDATHARFRAKDRWPGGPVDTRWSWF